MFPKIYKFEKEDGFTPEILGKSVSYLCPVLVDDKPNLNLTVANILSKPVDIKMESPDLFYLKSILLTTQINQNDEFFTPSEIWPARYTAKDKPLNVEHICDDIIGHMVASQPVNEAGEVMSDNLTIDELPEKFHIVSHAVLYKYWDKEDKQKRIDKIISEIPQGKWFVSVEALFPNFDYVLIDSQNNFKIVARNKQTSFLTKYLKVYNGKGVYNDCRLGRVPRNIILSGKGLVEQPANPESIILDSKFNASYNSVVYLDSVEIKKQEVKMDKEKELQKLIDELRAENMKLQASLQENNAKELAKQVESLTKNLSDKDEELKKVNASVIAKDESIKSLNAKTDEISKNHKEVSEKLAAIENEQKISKRILLVASKLKLAEADAKQFVENLNSLPDEIFTKHVEFEAGKLVASKIEEKVTEGRKADEKVLEKIEKPAQEINLVTASKKPEDGVKQINQAVSKILEKTMNKLFAEAKEVK